MLYKAKVAVCSEIRTKHINATWAPRRSFHCYICWYVKLPLGFKRLKIITTNGKIDTLVFNHMSYMK
jgi:hypothetical protein